MDVHTNQFLEGFTPAGREKLIGHLIYQDHEAGDYLFHEGDPAEGVCLVVDGEIELFRSVEERVEILNSIGAGGFLGEVAVLEGQGRGTGARVKVASTVAWIPTVDLLAVLDTEPVLLTIRLFQNVLRQQRETSDRNVEETIRKEKLSLIGEMSSSLMHDIRNPVQVMLSSVDLIRMNHSDTETVDCCNKMEKQCDRLVAMAGELLEFSRGEATLKLERTDTTTLLRQFLAFHEEAFRPVGTTFNVEDEPADVEVDSTRLLRVLQNLAANAVAALNAKPGGLVDVRGWVRDSMLHFSVRDNGPGIPPEIQARLFEPFVTLGSKGGTGLGLAIVKNIVIAHRGKISFETQAGQGTEFLVRIPQDATSPAVE